jgi:8-oxo-dGTP diphosphatase
MTNKKPFSLSIKVLIRKKNRYLLLRRSSENRSYRRMWEFPGGKLQPGETFADALIREVMEETGLSIALERVAGTTESEHPDWHIVHLILEAKWVSGEVRLSSEHMAYAWLPLQELTKMKLPAHFKHFADEYLRRRKSRASKR